MNAPDAPSADPGASGPTGEVHEAQPRTSADVPLPNPVGPTGAQGQSGVESSSGDYAPTPPRGSTPVASPRGPSPTQAPIGGEGAVPEQAPGRRVVPEGDLSAEVEEIVHVPPRSGPEEVGQTFRVGWFEGGETFEVDEAAEEEEMKRLLDPLLDVQGLVKVSPRPLVSISPFLGGCLDVTFPLELERPPQGEVASP